MVYLFYGDNDFLIQQGFRRLRDSLGPPDMVGLNTTYLEGDKVSFAELRAVCDAVPFLAPARLVVVEGLLAQMTARVARQGPRANSEAAASEEEEDAPRERRSPLPKQWEAFPAYCREVPETTHLVLLEGLLRNLSLVRMLGPATQVQEYRRLRGRALEEWTRGRAEELGVRIAPGALRLIVQLAGDNLWVLSSEVEKLSLYAAGATVEEAHVREVVSAARESTIFNLVDAVAEQNLAAALTALHRLLRDGIEPTHVLAMLYRQFRLILLALTLSSKGVRGRDLMARLGIGHEFAFNKVLEQGRRYTPDAVEHALSRLLEADLDIKTGKAQPDAVVQLVVASLCRGAGFAPARGRG